MRLLAPRGGWRTTLCSSRRRERLLSVGTGLPTRNLEPRRGVSPRILHFLGLKPARSARCTACRPPCTPGLAGRRLKPRTTAPHQGLQLPRSHSLQRWRDQRWQKCSTTHDLEVLLAHAKLSFTYRKVTSCHTLHARTGCVTKFVSQTTGDSESKELAARRQLLCNHAGNADHRQACGKRGKGGVSGREWMTRPRAEAHGRC